MPLKLNVGLSRKVGEPNYGSRGASVNLEMELDSALISEPGKLQDRIRQLFGVVRTSLAEELNGGSCHLKSGNEAGNGHQPSDSENHPQTAQRAPSGPRNGGQRLATPSQAKALYAITKAQRIDLIELLRSRFRVSRADDLTIKEASQLIDELKRSESEERGRG
jgi:hypothetical protein